MNVKMKYPKLLEHAKPYLRKNDLGAEHTLRVLEIAKKNYDRYDLDESWRDVVFSLIVLHDIGGKGVKEQYENGPKIAKELLEKSHIVVTPGVGFGPSGEGYVRFALTVPIERIKTALSRLSSFAA